MRPIIFALLLTFTLAPLARDALRVLENPRLVVVVFAFGFLCASAFTLGDD